MKYYQFIKDIIIVICLIAAAIGFFKLKSDLNTANNTIAGYQQHISSMEIEIGKIRAQTDITASNSELWKSEVSALKTDNDALYDAIKKANEQIISIGKVTTTVPESHDAGKPSDSVNTATNNTPKPTGSIPTEQVVSYNKNISIKGKSKDDVTKEVDFALASVKFYPKTKLWDVDTYGLNYNIDIIRAQREDGAISSYINAWMFNSKGDKIAVDVNAKFIELKLPEKKFFWWTPNVNITGDTHLGLGVSFSPMSYGTTKKDLDWRFGQIGISHNENGYYGKFIPFDWNIGQVIPFISNSYVGPSIDYDGDKFKYGLNLSVSF